MPLSLRPTLACCLLALALATPALGAKAPAADAKTTARSKSRKKAKKKPAPKAAATTDTSAPSPSHSATSSATAPATAPAAPLAPAATAATAPTAGPALVAPPPPPPAPPQPAVTAEGYRSVEAFAPAEAKPEGEVAAAGAPTKPLERLRILPRVGLVVPRTELSPGVLAGAEVGYRLPLLDDRLRLSLGAGYSFTSFKGARIVPGRGLDPAFIQNTTLVPVELILSADLLPAERWDGWGLIVGVGYGLYWTQSEITTLGGTTVQPSLAHAFVAALRATRALGPGALVVDVRYAEMRGDLGAFDDVGIATFSGFSFCLGYALDVL